MNIREILIVLILFLLFLIGMVIFAEQKKTCVESGGVFVRSSTAWHVCVKGK